MDKVEYCWAKALECTKHAEDTTDDEVREFFYCFERHGSGPLIIRRFSPGLRQSRSARARPGPDCGLH
jgi:hypothetical protein